MSNRRAHKILAAALTLVTTALVILRPVFAGELPEFYRGVRAMGMGNAFTALADDADAVFYNPAGLSLSRRINFHLFNPKFDVSKDDIASAASIREASSKFDNASLSKFFGKNIYASASVFPSIHLPGFVIGYYYGAQLNFVSRNVAMPSIEAKYIVDHGVVSGYGHEFRGFGRKDFFRAGVALKWLSRQGFEGQIPFSKLATANASYLKGLIGGPSTGIAFDLGAQYELPLTRTSDLIFGTAWHDIGDVSFDGAKPPPTLHNNLTLGAALVQRLGRFAGAIADVKLSADIRHVNDYVEPRLKGHLGAEFKMGDLSFQAGLNQSSLCGGMALDLSILKVSAVTYGVDTMTYAFMERERRYMLQLDLKFDIGGKLFRTQREEDRRKHSRDY